MAQSTVTECSEIKIQNLLFFLHFHPQRFLCVNIINFHIHEIQYQLQQAGIEFCELSLVTGLPSAKTRLFAQEKESN